MKFLLCSTFHNGLRVPDLFDTYEAAHNEMCEQVADLRETEVCSIKAAYLAGGTFDDLTHVYQYYADAEWKGNWGEWAIFAVRDDGSIICGWPYTSKRAEIDIDDGCPSAVDGDIYWNPCFGDLWIVDGNSFIKINEGTTCELDEPVGFEKVGHVEGIINRRRE